MTEPPSLSGVESGWSAVADVLATMGVQGHFELFPLAGGANNRVYRVESKGARRLLKSYFRHPYDSRDRLRTEFSFCTFAWNSGLRTIPRPLACSFRHGLALYEYVNGRQLRPGEITAERVVQALDFYVELNSRRHRPEALSLPLASEAWPRIADHLGCVDRRIARLGTMEDSSVLDREAAAFVRNDLATTWIAIRERVRASDLPAQGEISREDWCLSPSDFGFHNVILCEDGSLRFIDFEYAGWDDPARMICDFLCQQQVPVPKEYHGLAQDAVAAAVGNPGQYQRRVSLLLPVYRVKWCCILLNEFLPEGSARRRFAGTADDEEDRKAAQLEKARHMLTTVAPSDPGGVG